MDLNENPICLCCGHDRNSVWARGRDEEYFTTEDEFDFLRCAKCGALFIHPVPEDRLQEIYPPNYYSFDTGVTDSLVFKVKDRLDQRFFKKFISGLSHDRIAVLDVGGGSGLQLSTLKKTDPRIDRTVVVDLDEQAGNTARALGHEYFQGRFEDYFSAQPFEVILMLNLVEHVANPGKMLATAASLLSPGGIVIIKTPNTDSLDARLFRHKNWGGYHCPRHWVLFNRENFTALANRSGLKVKHFTYTQGAPFWTASILYGLARKGRIRVSKDRPVPQHPLYGPLNALFAMFDLARGVFAKTSQMIVILHRG